MQQQQKQQIQQITVIEKTNTSENSQKSENKKFELIQRKSKSKCRNFKNWSEVEDNLLKRLFRIYGNKWKIIGKHFPSRTPYQLCYRIKTLDENEKKNQEEQKNGKNFSEVKINLSQNSPISQNFSVRKSGKLFAEIIENSFFEKLENVEKALNSSKISRNANEKNLDFELNLNEENEKENFQLNLNFSETKDCLNSLGFLLRDINYLSLLKEDEDENKHFLILLKNSIKSYMSLITKMKKEL